MNKLHSFSATILHGITQAADSTVQRLNNSNTDFEALLLQRQEETIKAIQTQALSETKLRDYMQSTIADFANNILEKQDKLINTILEATLRDSGQQLNATESNNSTVVENPLFDDNTSIVTRKTLLIIGIIFIAICFILFTTTVFTLFWTLNEFIYRKCQNFRNKRRSGKSYTYKKVEEPIIKKPPPVTPRKDKNLSLPEIPTDLELQEITILADNDWDKVTV